MTSRANSRLRGDTGRRHRGPGADRTAQHRVGRRRRREAGARGGHGEISSSDRLAVSSARVPATTAPASATAPSITKTVATLFPAA